MNEFEKLLIGLKEQIQKLEETFIHQFIKDPTARPDARPDEYEFHVKAYCVLCHAALEGYFEDIVREVMNQYLEEWTNSGKYTDTLVTFVSYYGDEFLATVNKNNGISFRHLKRLLVPIAIEITDDIKLSSINTLARERGKYAHKHRKGGLAPEYAKDCVQDCLELCEEVKVKAENKFI